MKPIYIETTKKFEDFLLLYSSTTIVAHFYTKWSEQCKQINAVFDEIADDVDASKVTLCVIEAESAPEVSLSYKIVAVPCVIFLQNGNTIVDRVDGTYIPQIVTKIRAASDGKLQGKDEETYSLNARLLSLINQSKCMLFMKGNPNEPRCGFSKQMIALLDKHNADYDSFDILSDEAVRQGLKVYSNWPTYPQLYLDGELIGGLDIVSEALQSGELELPKKEDWNAKLKALINKSNIMVFMKGAVDQPKCKFSKALMEILNEKKIVFESFDILTDNEVRERLKQYSNWPTYPQVYVKGELIGGVDIIKELNESGELESTLNG